MINFRDKVSRKAFDSLASDVVAASVIDDIYRTPLLT